MKETAWWQSPVIPALGREAVTRRLWVMSQPGPHSKTCFKERMNTFKIAPISYNTTTSKFWFTNTSTGVRSTAETLEWTSEDSMENVKEDQSLTLPPLPTRHQVPSSVCLSSPSIVRYTGSSSLFPPRRCGCGKGSSSPYTFLCKVIESPLVSRPNWALAVLVHSWIESLAFLTPMEPYCTDNVILKIKKR